MVQRHGEQLGAATRAMVQLPREQLWCSGRGTAMEQRHGERFGAAARGTPMVTVQEIAFLTPWACVCVSENKTHFTEIHSMPNDSLQTRNPPSHQPLPSPRYAPSNLERWLCSGPTQQGVGLGSTPRHCVGR